MIQFIEFNKYILIFIALIGLLGCRQTVHKPVASWCPKTNLLEQVENENPQISGVTRDVLEFYDDLHKKNWELSYKYRTDTFKRTVFLDEYMKNVHSQPWDLLNYEIFKIQIIDSNSVSLSCKFIETPPLIVTTNIVTWKKQGDGWHCDAAGPDGLPVFGDIDN